MSVDFFPDPSGRKAHDDVARGDDYIMTGSNSWHPRYLSSEETNEEEDYSPVLILGK